MGGEEVILNNVTPPEKLETVYLVQDSAAEDIMENNKAYVKETHEEAKKILRAAVRSEGRKELSIRATSYHGYTEASAFTYLPDVADSSSESEVRVESSNEILILHDRCRYFP